MHFTWRPATDADWPRAWDIQRAAFEDLVTRAGGGWTEAQVKKCEAAWHAPSTRMVLQDGEVVGWVRLESAPDHDWLDLIVLAPEAQGDGLGAALMRRLMAEAGERPLWLSVYRENQARRLYARLGFRELPRDNVRVFMVWPPSTEGSPPRP
ncbi:MAG: GNAT family N-acetyltransferase [Alphaproteobacteria bacterium]|nr:GNAT family N-acetyltransferase [Alphaproteobacteria bacterium]